MKNIKKLLLLVLFLLLTIPIFSQSFQSAKNDSIVSLLADETGLSLVAPLDVPRSGTFWVVLPGGHGAIAPLPCPPQDSNLPIYSIATGQFIVDETANERASAASLLAQMTTVSNLITHVQHVTLNQQMMAEGLEIPFPGEGGDGSGDYTNYYNFIPIPLDTNLLWLEITNVSGGVVYGYLHRATNEVYAIWSTTNLLTPFSDWQIATEIFPTDTNSMPFVVSSANADDFFLKAEDLTGIDADSDGLPDWWEWYWFGDFAQTATNLDVENNLLFYDYTNNIEPNLINFSVGVTNNYINNFLSDIQLTIFSGVPAYYAVLVNDTNQTDAVWQPYTSSNLVVTLGADGVYEVVVGLRGHADTASPSWNDVILTKDTVPPAIAITNPVAGTVSQPIIQVQGRADEVLSRMTYDVSNAAGLFTNQSGYVTVEDLDTNAMAFTTSYFQCYDVALTNGLNVITVHATDLAGNTTTTNLNYTLDYSGDTTAPVVSLLWPQDGDSLSGTTFFLQAQVDDDTAKVTVILTDANGQTNVSTGIVRRDGTVQADDLPLAPGANQLTVTATDAAGNVTMTNRTIYQSSVQVTMEPLTDDQLKQSSVTVYGTVSDQDVSIYVNGIQAHHTDGIGDWEADNVPITGSRADFDVEIYTDEGEENATTHQTDQHQMNADLPEDTLVGHQKFSQLTPAVVVVSRFTDNDHVVYRNAYDGEAGSPGYGQHDDMTDWTYEEGGGTLEYAYFFNLPNGGGDTGGGWTQYSFDAGAQNSGVLNIFLPWMNASFTYSFAESGYSSNETKKTQTSLQVLSSASGILGDKDLYLVKAHASEYSDLSELPYGSGDQPMPPEWLQVQHQTLINTGLTNDDGSVWGATIISVPAGVNADVSPVATSVYQNYAYTFDAQATELNLQLALDNNRDGDISFDGSDQTTTASPYRFWVNNDYDGYDSGIADYADLNPADGSDANSLYINNTRDLEDYSRLWINTQGITEELKNGTFLLALEWKDTHDDPQMQFFQAAETNGGNLYLTDTNIAAQQVSSYGTHIIAFDHHNVVDKYNPFIFPTNFWSNISTDQPVAHLLFDTISRGSGQLVISIYKNDGVTKIAECPQSLYLKLQDVKEMYDRYTVGEDPATAPATTASVVTTLYSYDSTIPADDTYILFVHGWNLATWEKDAFAETAFKRLYWQGYKGHFGEFRWPTYTGDTTFDNSELNAWASATGLLNKLEDLNAEYPGNVYLMAHSLGNVVAGEALKRSGSNQVVNTYIAMQAAIASHTYDASATSRSLDHTGVNLDSGTPNCYANYYTNSAPCYFNGIAGAGTYVNFYNVDDWALATYAFSWEADQDSKPDELRGYEFDGTDFLHDAANLDFPQDTYEIFSACDEARCYALGAQPDMGGAFKKGGITRQVNLELSPYNFYNQHKDHSGEFNSDNMNRASFWDSVLGNFGFTR